MEERARGRKSAWEKERVGERNRRKQREQTREVTHMDIMKKRQLKKKDVQVHKIKQAYSRRDDDLISIRRKLLPRGRS